MKRVPFEVSATDPLVVTVTLASGKRVEITVRLAVSEAIDGEGSVTVADGRTLPIVNIATHHITTVRVLDDPAPPPAPGFTLGSKSSN